MSILPFTNFTKGELGPELHARIDTSQYGAGCKKVRNFIIQRYGGLALRPGFRLVGEVFDVTKNTRYIPFQFNLEQAYMMVLEEGNLRLLAQGGYVVENDLQITAITKATSAQITAAFHKYVVGDKIFLSGIVGMTELNGRTVTVASVVDANNFTVNINSLGFTTFVSATGIVRVADPTPPPAPPADPAPPPTPPAPAPTTTSGGTGTNTGSYYNWKYDYYNHNDAYIP